MRRVVTGFDESGKSVFTSDGRAPHGAALRGVEHFRIDEIWAVEGVPQLPAAREDPTLAAHQFFPAAGGTRFCVVTFPPAADLTRAAETGIDVAAAEAEFYSHFAGLAEHMEAAEPGMHRSKTVDYGVVISGEVCLELDDGVRKLLRAGDCVIQNGTRHAWRNLSDRECVMAFVVVGAR
jgi:mannose-6-phosphate isomerase-like protein (cupin superfamily)